MNTPYGTAAPTYEARPGPSSGDAPPGDALHLGELTGAQAAATLAANPVILLPLGSVESHGPGLPMGDYLLAGRIAHLIARAASDAGTACLVAPTLPFGGADFFGSVPGGIALAQSTFRAVLTDIAAALLRHGLTRLIVLNGHGGNSQAIHEVTLAIRRAHGVLVPSLNIWKAARALMDQLPGLAPAGRAGHGADPVASIALHLMALDPLPPSPPRTPATVLGLPVTDFASATLEGVPIDLPLELDEIAPLGIAPGADPSRANALDGQRLTDSLVQIGADLARRVAAA